MEKRVMKKINENINGVKKIANLVYIFKAAKKH